MVTFCSVTGLLHALFLFFSFLSFFFYYFFTSREDVCFLHCYMLSQSFKNQLKTLDSSLILLYVRNRGNKHQLAGLKLNFQKTKIMASGPITLWQIDGEKMEIVTDHFLGLQNHCRWWLQSWNLKTLAYWTKIYDNPRQHIKKQRHHFANKDSYRQSDGFTSSHV